MSGRLATFAAFCVASTFWFALIAAAPVLAASRDSASTRVAAAAYAVGAIVCHQRPERSFHTASVRWPVCARCTGLYAGGAAGLLLWGVLRRRPRGSGTTRPVRAPGLRAWTIAVAAPTAITVVTGALGVFDPSNAWRAALAVPLGAWVGGVLAAVLLGDLR